MTDEQYTFEQTRVRLEGILVEVRKKDTSLEQSLEMLEEGVRLLNQCNELIDQTAWRPATEAADGGESDAGSAIGESATAGAPGDGGDVDGGTEPPVSDDEARSTSAEDVPAEPVSVADEVPDDERD
jgi:exodeoxyribonuclease VII small subunit